MKRFFLLLWVSFFPLFCWAEEENKLSGEIGISPTTMGTFGEVLMLYYQPVSFIKMGLGGVHDVIYQKDQELEMLGGDLLGDVNKDIWSGVIQAGVPIGDENWELYSFISYDITGIYTDIMCRVLNPPATDASDPYPEDTWSFADISEEQIYHAPSINIHYNMNQKNFLFGLIGSYTPFFNNRLEDSFFQTIPYDNGTTLIHEWRKVGYSFDTKGDFFAYGGHLGLKIEQLHTQLKGFTRVSTFIHSGSGTVSSNYYIPYTGTNTNFDIVPDNIYGGLTKLSINSSLIEGGITMESEIKGYKPVLELTYIRSIQEMEFIYLNSMTKDKWIDDYDYFKIALSWGF